MDCSDECVGSEGVECEEELVTLDLGDGNPPVTLPCSVTNAFIHADLAMMGVAPPSFSLDLHLLRRDGNRSDNGMGWARLRGLSAQAAHRAEEALREVCEVRPGAVPPIDALLKVFGVATVHGAEIELPPALADPQEAACVFYDLLCSWHCPGPGDFAALVKVVEVLPSVYCLHVESRIVLANMFLRVQEYYECPDPKFRHACFTLEEYQAWYKTTSEVGKGGGFDYYLRWPGFNVPSWVLEDLRAGALGPLRPPEQALLALLPPARDAKPYYVIGTCEHDVNTLHHEMAHGLYATNGDYKEKVQTALAELPSEVHTMLKQRLLDMGYPDDPAIILDEMQAYMAEGGEMCGGGAAAIRGEVQAIFSTFIGTQN